MSNVKTASVDPVKKQEPLFQNGTLTIMMVDGVPEIKIDLPRERTGNLTAFRCEQFATMMFYLQFMQYDPTIDKALTKAGIKQGLEEVSERIINVKAKLMKSMAENNDKIEDEKPRVNADESFTDPVED